MIATAISKSLRVETDHISQSWNNTVRTRCWPDPELYWFIRTAGQGCAKKKLKHFCSRSACDNGYIDEGCKTLKKLETAAEIKDRTAVLHALHKNKKELKIRIEVAKKKKRCQVL